MFWQLPRDQDSKIPSESAFPNARSAAATEASSAST
ncbi:hypothetical protein L917_06997 [Phytophthora nicotianae]|uniref:Uncharacterized protein n=1 Tax=Phytophthora nicotianae TaxID=4792 RepID=W2NKC0_PHYNI|nr:hypothetical protein L917_06997 [Phytophthora nicotianae]ETM48383.1 hypothetical protein L914_07073 [Phytophthora nicotianae]